MHFRSTMAMVELNNGSLHEIIAQVICNCNYAHICIKRTYVCVLHSQACRQRFMFLQNSYNLVMVKPIYISYNTTCIIL